LTAPVSGTGGELLRLRASSIFHNIYFLVNLDSLRQRPQESNVRNSFLLHSLANHGGYARYSFNYTLRNFLILILASSDRYAAPTRNTSSLKSILSCVKLYFRFYSSAPPNLTKHPVFHVNNKQSLPRQTRQMYCKNFIFYLRVLLPHVSQIQKPSFHLPRWITRFMASIIFAPCSVDMEDTILSMLLIICRLTDSSVV